MENAITREEIRNRLAGLYRRLYDEWYTITELAKAAIHDGDDEAFRAITRRANQKSDLSDGVKAAAEALGIDNDELMAAVNSDRTETN